MVFLTTPWLDRQRIDLTLAATLREIGEYKGRAERVGVRVLQGMESLRLITAEHSAVAAGRLEKSDTSVEQANYQRLSLWLQEAPVTLTLTAALALELQTGLFQGAGRAADGFRSAEAAAALEELCANYRCQEVRMDPVLLAGAFFAALLSLRPFQTGNLRVAMLLAFWLLSRSGYSVARHVSLERIMETERGRGQSLLSDWPSQPELTDERLAECWICWGQWLLHAYRELAAREAALSGRRGAKTELVLAWIEAAPQDFSIREIQRQLPECGLELIRKIIKEQKRAGRIQCLGRGPNAVWRKKKGRKAKAL